VIGEDEASPLPLFEREMMVEGDRNLPLSPPEGKGTQMKKEHMHVKQMSELLNS
jgi:hypothetical protein